MGKNLEQTLVLIKPDALKNSLTGFILSQLAETHSGLRFAASKIVNVNRLLAEEHYSEHREKPFFNELIDYIMGRIHYPDSPQERRVIAIVYRGENAVSRIRELAGPTNPHVARDTQAGTVRSLGTVMPHVDAEGNENGIRIDNLIHASATAEEAEREIKLWFKPNNIPPMMRAYEHERCKQLYYFKDDSLLDHYEEGALCMLAPGEVAWKSDLEALQMIRAGKESDIPVRTIAAKYTINVFPAED